MRFDGGAEAAGVGTHTRADRARALAVSCAQPTWSRCSCRTAQMSAASSYRACTCSGSRSSKACRYFSARVRPTPHRPATLTACLRARLSACPPICVPARLRARPSACPPTTCHPARLPACLNCDVIMMAHRRRKQSASSKPCAQRMSRASRTTRPRRLRCAPALMPPAAARLTPSAKEAATGGLALARPPRRASSRSPPSPNPLRCSSGSSPNATASSTSARAHARSSSSFTTSSC